MKVLVIGNRVPWPLRDGGAIATFQLLKDLVENNNDVVYFTFNTQKHFVEKEAIDEHLGFCRVLTREKNSTPNFIEGALNLLNSSSYFLSRYSDAQGTERLKALLKKENFDLVQVEGLYSWPLVSPLLDDLKKKNIPVLYRAHNVESQIWERVCEDEKNVFKRWFLRNQTQKLKQEEIEVVNGVDGVVAISSDDASFFKKYGAEKVYVFMPSIWQGILPLKKIQPNAIFHIGSMEWEANVAGIHWFLRKVWPLLIEKLPDLQFHIAGKGINKHEQMFFQAGVVNHGEVADADDFIKNHGIGIVPIQAGSGIRMKLIQCMALGVPCVSTGVGVQGLNLDPDKPEVMIADNPKEFANAITYLLGHWRETIELGKRSHLYVQENHHPLKNLQGLEEYYRSFINKKG